MALDGVQPAFGLLELGATPSVLSLLGVLGLGQSQLGVEGLAQLRELLALALGGAQASLQVLAGVEGARQLGDGLLEQHAAVFERLFVALGGVFALQPLELLGQRSEVLTGFALGLFGELDAIVGGESGPKARAMDPEWVLDLRDQCLEAGVSFFFKQWGGTNKKRAGRELEGKTWNEMPTVSV